MAKIDVPVTKRADSGIYQATIAGQRISLGTRNREEAVRLASEAKLPQLAALARSDAITQQAIAALTGKAAPTMADLKEEWRAIREANGKSMGTVMKDMGVVDLFMRATKTADKPVNKVDERHVSAYINGQSENSAATRHRALASLRKFFEFALYKGYTSGNPANNVEVNYSALSHEQKERGGVEPFTEAEYKRLLNSEHLTDYWPAFVQIAYATGLRIGDVATLERACMGRDYLAVWTAKRKVRVCLPFDEKIAPGLKDVLHSIPKADEKYFFPVQAEIALSATRRSQLPVYFGRILARIGIENRSFHSLRCTCARRWRSVGFQLEDARVWLGHSSLATTRIYTGEK